MNRIALLLTGILCCSACTTLESDRHARELATSRQDDAYCVDHGLHYPDAGYVQCRRELVDRRLYRDWQNLRVMQQSAQPAGSGPQPAPSFRRPDPASFHCYAEPQFGNDYVFCAYADATDQ